MLSADVAPDAACMAALFGVCVSAQRADVAHDCLQKARARFAFAHDPASGSALLAAYARAGRTRDAEALVKELAASQLRPDERAYAALVSALARAGRHRDAVDALRDALRTPSARGIAPLFTGVLESCARTGDARAAREVVSEMCDVHFVPSGALVRNVVAAAVRGGDPALAEMMLFGEKDGFAAKYVPDRDDYSRMVAACSRAALPPVKRMREARRLFDRVRTESGVRMDVGHYNVLIATLGRVGGVAEARYVVEHEMDTVGIKPNVVSFNSLINACVVAANPYLALEALQMMTGRGIIPNQVTFNTLLNLAAEQGEGPVLAIVLKELRRNLDLVLDAQAVASILKFYRRVRDVDAAHRVVWTMHRQQERQVGAQKNGHLDAVVFCLLLTILVENRCETEAVTLFGFLIVRRMGGASPFNVLIQHFGVRLRECDRALELLAFMKRLQIAPDAKTYTIAIRAATADRRLQMAFRLLGEMQDVGLGCADTFAWTAVISACGKAGRWEHALELLNQMRGTGKDAARYAPPPTIAAYNAALYAVGMTRDGWTRARDVFGMLREDSRVQADEVTFSAMASIILKNRYAVKEVDIVRLVEGELEKEVSKLRAGQDYRRPSSAQRKSQGWRVPPAAGKQTERPGAAKKVAGKLKRVRWLLRDIEKVDDKGSGEKSS